MHLVFCLPSPSPIYQLTHSLIQLHIPSSFISPFTHSSLCPHILPLSSSHLLFCHLSHFYRALLPVSCGPCRPGSPRVPNSVSLYTILHSKLPSNISQLIRPAHPSMFYTFSSDSDFIHFTVNKVNASGNIQV